MHVRMRTAATAVLALCVLVALTLAQAPDARRAGRLTGTIHDASGTPLPDVVVTIAGPEGRTARTDGTGTFAFAGLLPGTYELRATLAGFTTLVQQVAVGASSTPLTL